MAEQGKIKRPILAAVLVCLVVALISFKAGHWYGGLGGLFTPAGAIGLLSGLSSATDSKIIEQYRKAQAALAVEAEKRADTLAVASRRRAAAEKQSDLAHEALELLEASATLQEVAVKTVEADVAFLQVLVEPPGPELADKAAKAVAAFREENEKLREVVVAQRVVIERQELVIRAFRSEKAEYDRNLILWKERYEKASKHIGRLGSRKTKIAVGILGVAAGVYVGRKWL